MANYSYSYDTYNTYAYANAQYGNTYARVPTVRRASTQKEVRRIDETDLVLGRVFWLPPKEELPPRAVKRAHGKGAVEEGIYNHPVVIVSRPGEEPQAVHFQIVTSFQGKRLHEIYSKDNEFHASRRSWYLPIWPSPIHPDATSKKMQKRFPTLELQHDATLRWDSYVNIRHVYKIDWTLLRPYSNPDTPAVQTFRFDRESCDKMLAKTKILTNYEPGPQTPVRSVASYPPRRAATSPLVPLRIPETPVRPPVQAVSPRGQEYSPRSHGYSPKSHSYRYSPRDQQTYSPKSYSDEGSVVGSEYSGVGLSPILQSDFGEPRIEGEMSIPVPRKRPPDGRCEKIWKLLILFLEWPLELLKRIREMFRS